MESSDAPGRGTGSVYPPGPALLYVPSPGADVLAFPGDIRPSAWRVDTGRITEGGPVSTDDARRERMILRALLNQALYLLGTEEG